MTSCRAVKLRGVLGGVGWKVRRMEAREQNCAFFCSYARARETSSSKPTVKEYRIVAEPEQKGTAPRGRGSRANKHSQEVRKSGAETPSNAQLAPFSGKVERKKKVKEIPAGRGFSMACVAEQGRSALRLKGGSGGPKLQSRVLSPGRAPTRDLKRGCTRLPCVGRPRSSKWGGN